MYPWKGVNSRENGPGPVAWALAAVVLLAAAALREASMAQDPLRFEEVLQAGLPRGEGPRAACRVDLEPASPVARVARGEAPVWPALAQTLGRLDLWSPRSIRQLPALLGVFSVLLLLTLGWKYRSPAAGILAAALLALHGPLVRSSRLLTPESLEIAIGLGLVLLAAVEPTTARRATLRARALPVLGLIAVGTSPGLLPIVAALTLYFSYRQLTGEWSQGRTAGRLFAVLLLGTAFLGLVGRPGRHGIPLPAISTSELLRLAGTLAESGGLRDDPILEQLLLVGSCGLILAGLWSRRRRLPPIGPPLPGSLRGLPIAAALIAAALLALQGRSRFQLADMSMLRTQIGICGLPIVLLVGQILASRRVRSLHQLVLRIPARLRGGADPLRFVVVVGFPLALALAAFLPDRRAFLLPFLPFLILTTACGALELRIAILGRLARLPACAVVAFLLVAAFAGVLDRPAPDAKAFRDARLAFGISERAQPGDLVLLRAAREQAALVQMLSPYDLEWHGTDFAAVLQTIGKRRVWIVDLPEAPATTELLRLAADLERMDEVREIESRATLYRRPR